MKNSENGANKQMSELTINLTGAFGGSYINEEIILSFESPPTILNLFNLLNQNYNTNAFTKIALKRNIIAILVNGQRKTQKNFLMTFGDFFLMQMKANF